MRTSVYRHSNLRDYTLFTCQRKRVNDEINHLGGENGEGETGEGETREGETGEGETGEGETGAGRREEGGDQGSSELLDINPDIAIPVII